MERHLPCGGTQDRRRARPPPGAREVTVLDPGDVTDLIDLLREEHGLGGTEQRLPTSQTLADICSRAVNTGVPTRQVMAEQFPWCLDHADRINELLKAYVGRKRARGLLDFDDLLLYWRALLADPEVGDRLRARWDWVLVDEYQDVNQIQVDIVRLLRPDGDGLTVVGDDAQAVYGFRGATSEHLLRLHRDLPGSTLVRLERNFRSTGQILDLANIIRPGELRLDLVADRGPSGPRPVHVRCANSDDEAREVADAVLAAHRDGLALRDQAVLFRTGTHSAQLEIELRVRGVPFHKYGGIGYLETAHVRDLVAAFRVSLNPADEISWYRILTRHRALGKVTARRLAALLVKGVDHAEVVAEAPPKSRTTLARTLELIRAASAAGETAPMVEACHLAVEPLLRQHYVDWSRRAADVEGVARAAALQRDLRTFIAEATIDPTSVAGDWAKKPHLDEDHLVLSTIHSAKGLEWSAVHLLRVTDGSLPSDMALTSAEGLAEEQRLFYVATTRARESLRVYTPMRLPVHPTSMGSRHVLCKPSRFLTGAALQVMDQVASAAVLAQPVPPTGTLPRPPAAPLIAVPDLGGLFG
ncbi:ATP-dependent helicase [Tessaracoccus sp. HDW20]|uniref:ATP-dependent helicase n=1 Tax=Tessaracoccus coleopterorum TaxID=2714950 RepID=UPI0018D2ECC0|nr:ATP-dependent helicase [Tessaracoccus coleopterorum]